MFLTSGKILLIPVLCFAMAACVLAPAIDSFQKLGVTPADRRGLFQTRFSRFQESMSWGRPEDVVAFIAGDKRRDIARDLTRILSEERIVEVKIALLEFSDDAFDAELDVLVRSFKVPYYVVNERRERQKWEFGMSGGWKLVGREDPAPALSPPA